MKTSILILFWLGLVSQWTLAQSSERPKIILITLDGLRWQELFNGADPLLIANTDYVQDTADTKKHFRRAQPEARRKALFPFLWTEVVRIGQLHGNRDLGSKVDLTNTMWFSYPGYNEILTGIADDTRIDSNEKIDNPNETILEIAQKDALYKDRIAAFGSWDVFPFIVNENRSGVPVNAGFELAEGKGLSAREQFLNQLQPQVPSPWSSVRLDAFTHHYALEYMKRKQPDLLYIAYGETDDFAHDGNYEAYLKSARNTDALIMELWEYTQQDPYYKDRTIFIVTTDHGRGTTPLETWKSHGSEVAGAGQVWLILFGKDIVPLGEVSREEQLYSTQIAPFIHEILGLKKPMKISHESLKRFIKE
jgi:hypothetical protein